MAQEENWTRGMRRDVPKPRNQININIKRTENKKKIKRTETKKLSVV
jgi:hypothetical protein